MKRMIEATDYPCTCDVQAGAVKHEWVDLSMADESFLRMDEGRFANIDLCEMYPILARSTSHNNNNTIQYHENNSMNNKILNKEGIKGAGKFSKGHGRHGNFEDFDK